VHDRSGGGALRAGKVVVALGSVAVLGLAGLTWSQLKTGVTTADVIDPGHVATSPADEQNILLVGLDTRTDAEGNPLPQDLLDQLHAGGTSDGGDNTDTMIVVHIPAGGGGATAFSIPRDSYVQLAGGFGKHKINSAYTYAQVAEANSLRAQGVSGAQLNVRAAQAGAKNAIKTVQQLTGLTFTHFASVNLVGFYNISQAIGGVPVCLKQATRDSFSGADFPAGPQTVSGKEALSFVRQRHGLPGGDLDRVKRQQAFMASLARTVLSGGTLADPTKLTNLIDAIKKTVTLDQGWDVLGFAQQMRNMSSGRIVFKTIPVGNVALKTIGDGEAVEVNPQEVQSAIKTAINAAGEAAPASATASPPSQVNSGAGGRKGDPAVTVDVRNASGANGLAASVSQSIAGLGFKAGSVANIATRHTSVVDYATGEQAAARQVADYLGNGVGIAADPSLARGHVRVLLGTDYHATAGSSGTAPAIQTPPPAGDAPITANGLTCVN
jgi:LCP family protein required for cell wall assembly